MMDVTSRSIEAIHEDPFDDIVTWGMVVEVFVVFFVDVVIAIDESDEFARGQVHPDISGVTRSHISV